MMKRKSTLIIVAILAIACLLFPPGNASAKGKMIICIGTGLAGATFYPMGAGISEIITNEIDEIKNATAQVTAASYENVRLLQRGCQLLD